MYLDHVVVVVQQTVLLYMVAHATNTTDSDRTVKHNFLQLYFNYFGALAICAAVILPNYTFDYLIVRSGFLSGLASQSIQH